VALYRITKQNWSKEKALEEMTEGGYGYHCIFGKLLVLIENF